MIDIRVFITAAILITAIYMALVWAYCVRIMRTYKSISVGDRITVTGADSEAYTATVTGKHDGMLYVKYDIGPMAAIPGESPCYVKNE